MIKAQISTMRSQHSISWNTCRCLCSLFTEFLYYICALVQICSLLKKVKIKLVILYIAACICHKLIYTWRLSNIYFLNLTLKILPLTMPLPHPSEMCCPGNTITKFYYHNHHIHCFSYLFLIFIHKVMSFIVIFFKLI